jgi:alkylation response protein AidB-like acyl-CoA dehydrogenase
MGLRAAGLGLLHLENVSLADTALLGTGDSQAHAEDYADAVRLARLGWASLAVGAGQAVLDYVIPYVNGRIAFGEPVSHRQAVAFMVANIAIELDGIRLVTLRGASRAEQGLSFAREAALAKKLATDHGMRIGLDGVQLLGGHGFTKEHPVERWYRDLRGVGVAEGIVLI